MVATAIALSERDPIHTVWHANFLWSAPSYFVGAAAAALAASLVSLLGLRRQWRARRKGRVKWITAGLSLWVFLAALTGIEIYFAIIYDESDTFNMTNVSKHWFARHIDPFRKVLRFSDGNLTEYRDEREFPTKLAEGQHHICFIGDSFTFGHGIKRTADRFSDRVGESLGRHRPGRFVVSNLSNPGRELRWVEIILEALIADKLRVDTLVYVICLNDIETFDERTANVSREASAKSSPWDSFLVRETYFLNLLGSRIRKVEVPRIGGYYENLAASYESAAWERMQAKLDDVHRLCLENGIDLRVAIFPFLHDLGPKYEFGEAHRRIAEHCREAGIPVLDLRPVLEPHVGQGLTVNPLDAHPNERAHALAAEAIERDLLGDLAEK
jgi:lysophospholipase L1-like esterase